ncbi:MAG: aminotransferase class III-fold pyridoxal phosphate-dependent enzyme [Myxococcales bacterium]|nr:aminotransferase class III-fold pyridoxal phosphate-dependent enzyme [Myxococcales bacterium]MCB9754825.1 aminotransferase class III-fold pyridoxal phosphate-dependent enzyme [Myxococcales bacterium]
MSAEDMSSEEMIALCKRHTMYTWARGDAVDPIPVARAEGAYIYTPEGQRLLDFNSQLMCVNIGHSHPKVIAAMKRQLDRQLLYVYPGTATGPRARLGRMLADIVPDPINTFFFTLGGAEANENAIKAARLYTGRHKILSRYRSYHGATHACMQLTGDPRRWENEPGPWGFVRVMDPQPYDFSFGATDEEQTRNHLAYLEDLIRMEGPETIAAMFVEPVTGTNGVLPPPRGWLKGLHALLRKYGILLVCDEVMAGFGRTGKWFSFQHGDIVPDIVTMAKGLTSSYAPLGAMGVSDAIAAHFQRNVFWGGLTYNAHALACATAEAVLEVMQEERLVERAAALQPVALEHMARLASKHRSVRAYRSIGLFGVIELQKNAAGETLAPFNGGHPAITRLAGFLRDNGLFTFVRWFNVMCNPPLCITEDELREGFEIIDRGLEITDAAFEG